MVRRGMQRAVTLTLDRGMGRAPDSARPSGSKDMRQAFVAALGTLAQPVAGRGPRTRGRDVANGAGR